MAEKTSEPPNTAKGEGPRGVTQGGAAPVGGYTLYQKLPCLRLGSGGLRPSSGQAREDSVGTETVKLLQTYPLTPFLLLRVLLTLEGSDANTVPADFDPSLAPQGPWVLSPRQQTVTPFSTSAWTWACVCLSKREHTLHGRAQPKSSAGIYSISATSSLRGTNLGRLRLG